MNGVDFSKLGQQQLATAHGTTTRTIQRWDLDGHPRNADGTYDLAASIAWRIDRELHDGLNLDGERARLARAQSEKAELDLKLRRGTLLERSDVVRGGQALMVAMRARMRAIPARLTPELSTPETYNAVRGLLTDAVDEALLEISNEKFAFAVAAHTLAERDYEGRGSAAEADGEPMGRSTSRSQQRVKRGAGPMEHRARRVPEGDHGFAE